MTEPHHRPETDHPRHDIDDHDHDHDHDHDNVDDYDEQNDSCDDGVYRDCGGPAEWSPALEARLADVCWAVAARDCAIEVGDPAAAAEFAGQARHAIAAAVAAGIDPAELADELSYPGGHTAMDGPHIDQQIAALHPHGAADLPDRPTLPTLSAVTGLTAAAAVTADGEAADVARHGQLARWHHDHSTDHTADDHDAHEAEDHDEHDDGWT